jgi:hypothetical protein
MSSVFGTITWLQTVNPVYAIVVTAPVGTLGQGVSVTFNSPIPVNPGEYIALVAKNVGTVTTAGGQHVHRDLRLLLDLNAKARIGQNS